MKYSTALFFAATASIAYAQSSNSTDNDDPEGAYLQEVCLPLNSTGYPDFNAPCNAMLAIQYECTFGTEQGLNLVNSVFGGNGSGDLGDADLPPMLSNVTQRDCICSSQFFAQVNGCIACQSKHGDGAEVDGVTPSYIASVSSGYCAASVTPTAGLGDYLGNVDEPSMTGSSATAAATTVFPDPIGSETAVSYYFTNSVTGTAAWSIANPSASVSTSNGQIVPTPTGNTAQRTQAAAVAGVIGLAGFVALL